MKEEKEAMIQRQESFAMIENEYRTIQKKIDEWGGEEQIKLCLQWVELLSQKNEELKNEVDEKDSRIASLGS